MAEVEQGDAISRVVVDTSVLIAVVTNEPCKSEVIRLTAGRELWAPASVPWEIGNAFSAMFKRRRLDLSQARVALEAYRRIEIRLSDVDLQAALELSSEFDIYAYDAYLLACAHRLSCPLISLDNGLLRAARRSGIQVLEVPS